MEKYEAAIEYYEKARSGVDDPMDVKYAGLYVNMGFVLCSMKRYEDALESLHTALNIFKDPSLHKMERAFCFANIADIKFDQKKYTESISYLESAIDIYEELQIPEAKINALMAMARAQMALEEYEAGYEVLKKTLQSFTKEEYLRLYIFGIKLIIKVTKQLNKLEECIAYQNELIELQSNTSIPKKRRK